MAVKREYFIPKEYSEKRVIENIKFEIYNYEEGGYSLTMIFKGRQSKPFKHYRFDTAEARENFIQKEVEEATRVFEQNKAYKAKKKEGLKNVKVGDLFYDTWGYDQTNVDFYQVIDKKGQKVTFRPISQTLVSEDKRADYGKVKANIDDFIGEPFTKVLRSDTFKTTSYSFAKRMEDPTKEIYTSWGR